MIVGIEATSLIGARSGVGHATASLIEALVAVDEGVECVLLPISLRRGGWVRDAVPRHPRLRVARARLPARVAQAVWARMSWPPAELFCGALDVFWGPNYMLPPLLKAAGVLSIYDLAFVRVPETCSAHVLTYRTTVPQAAARAHRLVVPSRFVANEVAAWLPAEAGRIRVVPCGVRRVFRERGGPLTPARREALGIRDPYAVFLGNLELRKNIEVLLRAFAQVLRVHPGAQLVLVGAPGVGWETVRARCADVLDSGAVRVVGYLPDEEAAAVVRGARVFVYPSRYEGFGLPPLEAMAAGIPVVAAKAAALPEVLGDHARLVGPDDVDGLAAAVADYFDGSPEPAALEAARSWAASYTWGEAARGMLRVLAEAAGRA